MKNLIRCSTLLFCTAFLFTACSKKSDTASPNAPANAGDAAATSGKAPSAEAAQSPASGRAVEITANDAMKFSITEIKAKAGEPLSITMKNVGNTPKFSMGHNFVLLKKGTNVEAFATEAMNAAATDYVPAEKKDEVIAHTKLLGPKESDTVTFNAPSEPGRYPFLCSFPGHYQVGMKGELVVE